MFGADGLQTTRTTNPDSSSRGQRCFQHQTTSGTHTKITMHTNTVIPRHFTYLGLTDLEMREGYAGSHQTSPSPLQSGHMMVIVGSESQGSSISPEPLHLSHFVLTRGGDHEPISWQIWQFESSCGLQRDFTK